MQKNTKSNWRPKPGDKVYLLKGTDFDICITDFNIVSLKNKILKNCFRTFEDAQHAKELIQTTLDIFKKSYYG